MADYKLSNSAKEDLVRIHQYGIQKSGIQQADKYFYGFFDSFDKIAEHPYHFESVDYIKAGYRRCVYEADSIFYRIREDKVEIMAIIGRNHGHHRQTRHRRDLKINRQSPRARRRAADL